MPNPILVFLVGLLIGLVLFPACKRAFQAPGVRSFVAVLSQYLAPPFLRTAPAFGKKGVPQETGSELPSPAFPRVDQREQQIDDTAQAVRSILILLSAVIERTEQATSASSRALRQLRENFDLAGLPAEMAAATSRLTEQIDRMISHNASLMGKLASSQKILTAQQRQIETLRTAVLVDGMTQATAIQPRPFSRPRAIGNKQQQCTPTIKRSRPALYPLKSARLSLIMRRSFFMGGGIMKKIVVLLLLMASTASGEIYTWKDARGTLFYTNSLYEIPARFRSRAKLLDAATGKKLPISAAQPDAGAPATPGQAAASQPAAPQPAPAQPAAVPQPGAQPAPAPAGATRHASPDPAAQAPSGVTSPAQAGQARRGALRQNRTRNRED